MIETITCLAALLTLVIAAVTYLQVSKNNKDVKANPQTHMDALLEAGYNVQSVDFESGDFFALVQKTRQAYQTTAKKQTTVWQVPVADDEIVITVRKKNSVKQEVELEAGPIID